MADSRFAEKQDFDYDNDENGSLWNETDDIEALKEIRAKLQEDDHFRRAIGARLYNARRLRGLTREKMALACRMSIYRLTAIEHGVKWPIFDLAGMTLPKRICHVLDFDITDLFSDNFNDMDILPHRGALPGACLMPGCDGLSRTRGVCQSCYVLMRSLIKDGQVTDEELVEKGIFAEKKKLGGGRHAKLDRLKVVLEKKDMTVPEPTFVPKTKQELFEEFDAVPKPKDEPGPQPKSPLLDSSKLPLSPTYTTPPDTKHLETPPWIAVAQNARQ